MAFTAYAASKYGKTLKCAFSADPTTTEYLLAEAPVAYPLLFIIKVSEACYFRHGPQDMDVVTDLDFEMDPDKEYPLLVESANDLYISIMGVDSSGYLKATQTSQRTDDASEEPSAL